MKSVALLGSTGSIGTQTLDVIREQREDFNIFALSAHSNIDLLYKQIVEFQPEVVVVTQEQAYQKLQSQSISKQVELIFGSDALPEVIARKEVDFVLNALVGFAGFESTYAALAAGKTIGLANKESLVVGGELLLKTFPNMHDRLLPVDSEHSAIFQCLTGENRSHIKTLILTASGGPFRSFEKAQMQHVTVAQTLKHPNWNMGGKITVDSATMMNKGLEFIEAYWLFPVKIEQIQAVIHPQSIIHSMVEFCDGSIKAKLSKPDMRLPIHYALTYPERSSLTYDSIDWTQIGDLSFEGLDESKFPCFRLAKEAIYQAGLAPTVLNAANEIAVSRFLSGEIGYINIARLVEATLEHIQPQDSISKQSIMETDRLSREFAQHFSI